MSLWLPPARRDDTGSVATGEPRPALFLDRDGCLIEERHYLADPAAVTLLPGVGDALRRARTAGYLLIAVSNQSGLGRGRFTIAELEAVMARCDELLVAAGAGLDAYFYCPHAPADHCPCRKPALGLLAEAARRFAWDPRRSWVIGDKQSDVDLGIRAGIGALLVRTGYGSAEERRLAGRSARDAVTVVDDLSAAVAGILAGGAP
jgi:histidinol-phosphate phosphatase family protein